MTSKLKSDLWRQLVAEAGAEKEDAIARAASVSVKEAEEELAAAGFDVAAERAKASAFLDALASESLRDAASAVEQDARRNALAPRRKRQRPLVLWVAAVVAAVVAGGVLYAALQRSPAPPPTPPLPSPSTPVPVPSAVPDLVAAAQLRSEAASACAANEWTSCLMKLDQARAADPAGDDAPGVRALRDQAIAGFLHEQKKLPVP